MQLSFDLIPTYFLQVHQLSNNQDRAILWLRVASRRLKLQHHASHFCVRDGGIAVHRRWPGDGNRERTNILLRDCVNWKLRTWHKEVVLIYDLKKGIHAHVHFSWTCLINERIKAKPIGLLWFLALFFFWRECYIKQDIYSKSDPESSTWCDKEATEVVHV